MTIPDKSEDIESFDRRAGGYEASFTQRLFFDPVQRAVLDLAARDAPPENILDIGCGTGRLLRKAAARWPDARLIGVDPADGMIRQARQRTPQATFFSGQAEALPLPAASFDLITSTNSFHHWADQRQGIREVARTLRPGGQFVLADLLLPAGSPPPVPAWPPGGTCRGSSYVCRGGAAGSVPASAVRPFYLDHAR